jgi:two-component system, response regulator PdtaR
MPALPQPAPVTVLIVEDEPVIRLYEAELAEGAGYIALAASNADEALEALEASAQIEILLTDVRMPGSMDGLALAEAVPNRWPDKMIVIASGHRAGSRRRPHPRYDSRRWQVRRHRRKEVQSHVPALLPAASSIRTNRTSAIRA